MQITVCLIVDILSRTYIFLTNNFDKKRQQLSEAAIHSSSVKKVFLKVLQNSQESTCAKVSFLIKLQARGLHFY